jgi:hypothetical protein
VRLVQLVAVDLVHCQHCGLWCRELNEREAAAVDGVCGVCVVWCCLVCPCERMRRIGRSAGGADIMPKE